MAFTTSAERLVSFQGGKIDIIDRPGIIYRQTYVPPPYYVTVSPDFQNGIGHRLLHRCGELHPLYELKSVARAS